MKPTLVTTPNPDPSSQLISFFGQSLVLNEEEYLLELSYQPDRELATPAAIADWLHQLLDRTELTTVEELGQLILEKFYDQLLPTEVTLSLGAELMHEQGVIQHQIELTKTQPRR